MKRTQRGFLDLLSVLHGTVVLLEFIPGWLWAALLLGSILMSCGKTHDIENEKMAHALTKQAYEDYSRKVDKREAERNRLAAEESERQRELDRNRNKANTEAQHALLEETARNAAARGAAAERSRLLNDEITRYASGAAGRPAGADSDALARAEQRAAGFGKLLATCRAEGSVDAGELEDLASQVRGLLKVYRSLTAPALPATP